MAVQPPKTQTTEKFDNDEKVDTSELMKMMIMIIRRRFAHLNLDGSVEHMRYHVRRLISQICLYW